MEFRFHTDTITTLIEVTANPSSSFPPIWKILAKIPPLSAHCISKRAYFHVNYFRISARKCFVGKKKRKKWKKIFLSNDGFLIYSTLSISTRDASRRYILPSFSTIKFYANLSKNIDNSDKTTVRNRIGLYIETLNPRSLARNLSALIINAMFNAYFAMLITRLTPVTSRTV